MKIQNRSFVAIDYVLSLDSGETVDRSEPGQPLEFIYGCGMLIPGLEKALEGMSIGQDTKVTVEADEAYGQPNPQLHRELPRGGFPKNLDLRPGMVFEAETPKGQIPFRVKEVSEEVVLADFNHPLAGERLHFDIKIVEVRKATEEEISQTQETIGCRPDSCGQGCCG